MTAPPRPRRRTPTVMGAAVLEAPERARLAWVPRPEPGPRQVRVRVEGCGVCGSNLPLWEGRSWFQYPREPGSPGHEAWGRIDAIGSEVEGWVPDERVGFLSEHGFAEFDLAATDALVRLPAQLTDRPFPGEALACGVNVFGRAGITAGETVAVVGMGFLGALVVQLAVAAGARVLVLSRRAFARDAALRMGAIGTASTEDGHRALGAVADLTGGDGADCVIEATGLQQPLDLAAELTRVRGRLVIAGYHQDGLRTVNLQLWNWRGLDVINAHERDPRVYVEGMRTAVAAIAAGTLDPEPLYTHQLPLGELGAALDLLRERPQGFLKALVIA